MRCVKDAPKLRPVSGSDPRFLIVNVNFNYLKVTDVLQDSCYPAVASELGEWKGWQTRRF